MGAVSHTHWQWDSSSGDAKDNVMNTVSFINVKSGDMATTFDLNVPPVISLDS